MSSNYDKNYSALRKIINDDETIYSRQFVKFFFNRRRGEDTQLKGIYNVLTNNVVAMINRKGNVFFRANSIYANHIKESSNKVILDTNMRRYKGYVGGHEKMYGKMNMMAEKASERLIENDDKPNKVFLFYWNPNERLDDRWIIRRIKELVRPKDDSNTGYALKMNSIIGEEDKKNNRYKAYLTIEDYAEQIKIEARQNKAKKNIVSSLLDNLADIVQNSITSRGVLNPLQFTYRDEEGELYGTLRMRDLYLDLPSDIEIREYYSVEQLMGLVRFSDERLGSLVEQGVDEIELRQEQERRERERQEAMLRQMQHYATMTPGGVYRYDGSTVTSYYGEPFVAPPRPRVAHMFVDEATTLSREEVEAMITPPEWDMPVSRSGMDAPDTNSTMSSA